MAQSNAARAAADAATPTPAAAAASDTSEAGAAAAGTEDLAGLTAVAALRAFRRGELAPSELLAANLARIAAADGTVNAVTELVEDASQRARAADRRYAAGDIAAPLGAGDTALLGLPVATKEKHQIAGRTISLGLVADRDLRAVRSDAIIERILAAGGVIHARTASPEYSCATVTHTPLWGVTRNPHAPEFSPGGSSGGAGAALAAGYAPLATSSDIAGSTRIPAAYSGVVGYKAPYGRIPGNPPLAADWYRGDGAMARSVADTALLTNVMSGISASDHATVPGEGPLPTEFPDPTTWLRGARIALSVTLGDYAVHPEIAAATRRVARLLAAHGATVDEVTLPWRTEEISRVSLAHFGQVLVPAMRDLTAGKAGLARYTERFMADAEAAARELSLWDTLRAEAVLQQQLADAMRGYDALLAPVNAVRELAADGDYLDGIDAVTERGERVRLRHYWEGHMTVPFNIANRCPVIAVPTGRADSGVPIGVQFVGHPFQETAVFRAAAALEALQPWAPLARIEDL